MFILFISTNPALVMVEAIIYCTMMIVGSFTLFLLAEINIQLKDAVVSTVPVYWYAMVVLVLV